MNPPAQELKKHVSAAFRIGTAKEDCAQTGNPGIEATNLSGEIDPTRKLPYI